MNRIFIGTFAAILGSLITAGVTLAISIQSDIVALTGTDGPLGPGLGAGVTFANSFSFIPPTINSTGTVAFTAAINDGQIRGGVWRANQGLSPLPLAVVGNDGSLGPGLGAATVFTQVGEELRLNDRGDVFFLGAKNGPGSLGDRGVWIVESGQAPRPLALSGESGSYGPGLGPDFRYVQFRGDLLVNSNSDAAFSAYIDGPGVDGGNGLGIWHSTVGNAPQVWARTGDAGELGPGLGPGVVFNEFGLNAMDESGAVYTVSSLFDNGAFRDTQYAVAKLERPGPANIFARSATAGALGPNSGSLRFQPNGFTGLEVNTAGQIVLIGNVAEYSQNTWSVVTLEGAVTPRQIVARRGVDGPLGPHLGPDKTFSFFESVVVGGGGHIATIARFQDMLDMAGVLVIPPGGPPTAYALSHTDGSLGPNLGPGVMFGTFNAPEFFMPDLPLINSSGDVAFRAILFGPSVNETNNMGLWLISNGVRTLLERTGEQKDVDPSIELDIRTISGIYVLSGSGGQDGGASALTDDRKLVYSLSFTDGSSGIFTVQIVPEPSTVILAAFALLVVGNARKLEIRR